MATFASSYIKTNGTALTRNRDRLSFPYNARPQAMTVYVRFVERGTVLITNARILHIGLANSANAPLLDILETSAGGKYRVVYNSGTGSVSSSLTAAPSINDIVELRVTLTGAGVAQIHQSINGATETSATAASALTLPQTWAGTDVELNATIAGNTGFSAFTNIVITRGVQTLETMRRMAGTK